MNLVIMRTVFAISLFAACNNTRTQGDSTIHDDRHDEPIPVRVTPGRVIRVGQIGTPDTLADRKNYLFRIVDIARGSGDRLYILDFLNRKVRIYSVATGVEISSFGSKGSGPGEFLFPVRLKYVRGKGIMVVDLVLRRATFFNKKNEVTETIHLSYPIDDLDFLSDSEMVTSSYRLSNAFKPLRIVDRRSGRVKEAFGNVQEAQKGLIKRIESSAFARSDIDLLSSGSKTRVLLLRDEDALVYSQKNPYVLYRIDLRSKKSVRFDVPVPFSTQDNISYDVKGDSRTVVLKPSGGALGSRIIDGMVLVPIFDETCSDNFVDCYEPSGRLVQRLSVPALPRGSQVLAADIDQKRELFVLVVAANDLCWISRYRIGL